MIANACYIALLTHSVLNSTLLRYSLKYLSHFANIGVLQINTSIEKGDPKIAEFNLAMQRYSNKSIYICLERITSIGVLGFQISTLIHLLWAYKGTGFILIISAVILAYILADLVNGLVHLYMDNNTQYNSIAGPFISSFHLHHLRPRYTIRHPLQVYFYESGTKFWLLAYLIGVFLIQHYSHHLAFSLNIFLVFTGIFSSIAEVSHYWCHATKTNKFIRFLQKYGVLLSKQHHSAHHQGDNINYAFLNGVSDPLINKIAHYYYAGYKNNADKHTAAYIKTRTGSNQD